MIRALLLTLRQLPDPAFFSPLLKAGLLALLAFGGAAWGAGWAMQHWLAGTSGWLAEIAATLSGLLVLASALWLALPVILALTGLFLDPVAAAVERRFYPALPPARGASLGATIGYGLSLGVKMLVLNLLALPLLIPPLTPFGAAVYFLLATWALGHGTFEGVAQRRMSVADSRAARRAQAGGVLGIGAVLAAMALVPFLNLLVPVLGTAAMTHLLHRGRGGISREFPR